jgi:hypothetical protein
MPRSEAGRSGHRRRSVLRVLGAVLAAAMGIVAIWLIVTADTTKRTQIGALLGFWALLIAVYPVLGARHPRAETGQELDLRSSGRLERAEDAAERVEYERRLQLMVRHEIQSALGSELADLRSEVSALRSEILEKVGGQIRLERIETTRMVGSNIEALKREVRQLKVANQHDDLFALDSTTTFVSSMDDAAGAETAYIAATEPVPPVPLVPRVPPVRPAQVADPLPPRPLESAPAAEPLAPVQPAPAVESLPPLTSLQPAPVPREVKSAEDPFASMPRIKPFTDFPLDEQDEPIAAPEDDYAGRRRQNGETAVSFSPSGRHAGGEADWATATPNGGRRRRESSDEDDVLAKILEREGTRQ